MRDIRIRLSECLRGDFKIGDIPLCLGHLRGHKTPPYKVIKLILLIGQMLLLYRLALRSGSVGRIASCACWAFLLDVK